MLFQVKKNMGCPSYGTALIGNNTVHVLPILWWHTVLGLLTHLSSWTKCHNRMDLLSTWNIIKINILVHSLIQFKFLKLVKVSRCLFVGHYHFDIVACQRAGFSSLPTQGRRQWPCWSLVSLPLQLLDFPCPLQIINVRRLTGLVQLVPLLLECNQHKLVQHRYSQEMVPLFLPALSLQWKSIQEN